MELLLSATIDAALESNAVKPRDLKRVTVDSTVQENAIAFPTDPRLYNRARERLVRLAKAHGVPLRQSYVRVGPRLLFKNNRYRHARQLRRQRRTTAKLKTVLGRVYRDIGRPKPPSIETIRVIVKYGDIYKNTLQRLIIAATTVTPFLYYPTVTRHAVRL